jgi:hypothetical protein
MVSARSSVAGKDARALTRSGLEWSDKYQRMIEALPQAALAGCADRWRK